MMGQTDTGASAWMELRGAVLHCGGSWTLSAAPRLDADLRAISWPPAAQLHIDFQTLRELDTVGAWLLVRSQRELEGRGARVYWDNVSEEAAGLLARVQAAGEQPVAAALAPRLTIGDDVRVTLDRHARQTVDYLSFLGELMITAGVVLARPTRIRWRAMLHNLQAAGLNAMPIVGLLSFLIGLVIAYQSIVQLRPFGATVFVADLVGFSMIRELAPLMTAVIVAGRTGSAFTAEIGTMRVTEEYDALRAVGLGPMDVLVLPKLVALLIALPLLTVFADVLGVLGGMFMAKATLGMGASSFLSRMTVTVGLGSFLSGVGKTPVFAAIIATVGCYHGTRASGSAEEVGVRTTMTVVQSTFLVIVTDAMFSVAFSMVGI